MTETSRLYAKARHVSYQRSKHLTHPNVSLVKIEGVESPEEARFYLGKRIAFVYRAKKEIGGTKTRVIWGRVTRTHGNNGVVRTRFRKNLPPHSLGSSLRVMLYPSQI